MLDLAQLVIDLTGSASSLVFKPSPADGPLHRKPDISRARQKLGWDPGVALDVGPRKTITYFESMLTRLGGARH